MNNSQHARNKRKFILYSKIAAAGIVVVILIVGAVRLSHHPESADTSAGLSLIKEYEAKDIATIEAKIENVAAKERIDAYKAGNVSLKEMFSNYVVMGNSIAEGFSSYDILNANSVIAKRGVSLTALDAQYEQLVKLQPQIIFLDYGLNDILNTSGNTDTFTKEYTDFITRIQQGLPTAKIYVNSIFPVLQKAIDKNPVFASISSYNEALQAICTNLGVTYIDNSSIVSDDYYSDDGIHFRSTFYPIWADHMLEATLS